MNTVSKGILRRKAGQRSSGRAQGLLDRIPKISQFSGEQLEKKVVFVRLDLNLPLDSQGEPGDLTRLQGALPTLRYLIDQKAKLVLASHWGRPETLPSEEAHSKLSLQKVGRLLAQELNLEVILSESANAEANGGLARGLKVGSQLLLLENLRFLSGEKKNDLYFAKQMAEYTDLYINDAFGVSHRCHASVHALPTLLLNKGKTVGMGFLMEKECTQLQRLLTQVERPYWVVLGGAKVADKIPLMEKLMEVADGFLLGGAMAYTFLWQRGKPVGACKVEKDVLSHVKYIASYLETRNKPLILPCDHVVAPHAEVEDPTQVNIKMQLREGDLAFDIGPKTQDHFCKAIQGAKSLFWNGPMGLFEREAFAQGSRNFAKTFASSSAFTVVGGGDSLALLQQMGLASKIDHLSTGGGASLQFLEKGTLPALEVLALPRKGVLQEE